MTRNHFLGALTRLALPSTLLLCAAACTSQTNTSTVPVTAQDNWAVQTASPTGDNNPPTLSEMEGYAPADNDVSDKEKSRLESVRQEALAYGLQGGLAHGTKQIDDLVRSQAAFLTQTFDFGPLMIASPYGTKILPPVIVESNQIYNQVDPNTIVVADRRYHILYPAAFAPVQPLWSFYLLVPWTEPAAPDPGFLPDTALEHKVWDAALQKGYAIGEQQAFDQFRINLNRLSREYLGMIRWNRLVASGEATAPMVTSEMKSVVGGGDTVTIHQGKVEIVNNAILLPKAD